MRSLRSMSSKASKTSLPRSRSVTGKTAAHIVQTGRKRSAVTALVGAPTARKQAHPVTADVVHTNVPRTRQRVKILSTHSPKVIQQTRTGLRYSTKVAKQARVSSVRQFAVTSRVMQRGVKYLSLSDSSIHQSNSNLPSTIETQNRKVNKCATISIPASESLRTKKIRIVGIRETAEEAEKNGRNENLRQWYITQELRFSQDKCRFEEANRLEMSARVMHECGRIDDNELAGVLGACRMAREESGGNEGHEDRSTRVFEVQNCITKATQKRWTDAVIKDNEERFHKRSVFLMKQPAYCISPCGQYVGHTGTHKCPGSRA